MRRGTRNCKKKGGKEGAHSILTQDFGAALEEGPVKKVAVVSDHHIWLHFLWRQAKSQRTAEQEFERAPQGKTLAAWHKAHSVEISFDEYTARAPGRGRKSDE
jgi:hypothetical protein